MLVVVLCGGVVRLTYVLTLPIVASAHVYSIVLSWRLRIARLSCNENVMHATNQGDYRTTKMLLLDFKEKFRFDLDW